MSTLNYSASNVQNRGDIVTTGPMVITSRSENAWLLASAEIGIADVALNHRPASLRRQQCNFYCASADSARKIRQIISQRVALRN